MRIELIDRSHSLYRDAFIIRGYVFGTGSKSLCIVGSTRGNEYQQLYVCSKLVESLARAEDEGRLAEGHEIMVIPSCNPSSMNIEKRFWPIDNTDINRMFPGYDRGETTQRIADCIFRAVQDYAVGIQLTSFYMPGLFLPHVVIMQTELEYTALAADLEVPYVVVRRPRPFDTTTLNYNWQIWESRAFSLYTTSTDSLNPVSALQGVRHILGFMLRRGLMHGTPAAAQPCRVLNEDEDVLSVRTRSAGFFIPRVQVQEQVACGQVLARIEDTTRGTLLEEVRAPCAGTVFFMHSRPLVYSHTAAIKIIRDEGRGPPAP